MVLNNALQLSEIDHLTAARAPDTLRSLISSSTFLALFFKPPAPLASSTTVVPSTLSIKPPCSELNTDNRTANSSSISGIFKVASKSKPVSPLFTVEAPRPKLPLNSEASGLLVIKRIVPVCEDAPKSVDCGPARASMRAMSTG